MMTAKSAGIAGPSHGVGAGGMHELLAAGSGTAR